MYGQILINPEIADEVGERLPEWIVIKRVANQKYQTLLKSSLDLGESSAIALASEYEDPLIILDDTKARNFAKSLNISYTGTVGVLLNAKKQGIIKNLKEILEEIEKTDFRLTKELIELVLTLAGEN